MKKAISMKCNPEQWESIKPKLVGCAIYVCDDLENYKYLVNNFDGGNNIINNVSSIDKFNYNREVHEVWNEQIFLEACGIETTIKGSDLQYFCKYENKWMNCINEKYRMKPNNSAKIAELKEQIRQLETQLKNL